MSFTLKFSHIKFLMRQYQHYIYMSYHPVFPIKGFFGDDILRHCYNDYHGVSPLFSHWVLRSFNLIYQSFLSFFP